MNWLIVSLIIYVTQALQLRESHQSWFQQRKNLPGWNKCDQRCLDFEKRTANVDFYIVTFFAGSILNPAKTACYGANS